MNIKIHHTSRSPATYFDGDIDIRLTETCVILKYFDVERERNVEIIIPLTSILQMEVLE